MPYPFWDVAVGYGLLMAALAVIHVFVSHFAIGGGLYLVLTERAARRRGDEARLAFVRRLSKFFILVTVVFGALTGVGIWFIIGLLNPAATEALIHNFVWGWAIEWTFFIVEILAAMLYFYGWKRLSAKHHLTLGWIYFAAAWLSLVVINGIVTFMLTPGAWLETGSFWDGFLNPTYWPSLFFRTGICVMLAGLFALFVASMEKSDDHKPPLIRLNARWALVGLAVAALSWLWYQGALDTAGVWEAARERLRIPLTSFNWGQMLTAALLAVLAILGLVLPRLYRPVVGVAVLILGLAWFGAFEWFRESARKPFAVHGYMYAHGWRTDKWDAIGDEGLLAHVPFQTGDVGADMFRYSCRTCHTLDGYNGVKKYFDGTDRAFVDGALLGLHEMRIVMPAFRGNDEERAALADWLWKRMDPRPLHEITGMEGAALGEAVFERRCAICHELGGDHNDPSDTLADLEDEDYADILREEFADTMPVFDGDEKDFEALVTYLKTLRKGGAE